MQAKNVLYAAVGAPVVAARKVSDQVSELRGKVSKETSGYTEKAEKAIDGWANEGEKVVSQISEGKVVEEISQKVDLDQAKEQVSKLRDQLEDMLATWRHSFRPEQAEEKAPADKTAAKPAAKKPAAKKPAAKKPATKKTSAAQTTKSSTAAKKSSAKTSAAKAKAS
jgi:hypothetical protein